MNNPLQPDLNPRLEEMMRLGKCWVWLVVFGTITILLGFFAISTQWIATLATILVFGILLAAAGALQIVNAIMAISWKGFFLHMLAGVLHLIVGGMMIEQPLRAAEVVTLILAVAFMVGGVARILYVLTQRFAGWPWVLLNGAVTLILGVLIWRNWPEASMWVIGTFVGIDLVFNGWAWVMLGLAVKGVVSKAQSAKPQAV